MFSAESLCPSKEFSSIASITGSCLHFSTPSSSSSSHQVSLILRQPPTPWFLYGLSLNFWITNATKFWEISDVHQNQKMINNTKMLQKSVKFLTATVSIWWVAQTTFGKASAGSCSPFWPKTTLHLSSLCSLWCRWHNGPWKSTEGTEKSLETNIPKIEKPYSPSSYDRNQIWHLCLFIII